MEGQGELGLTRASGSKTMLEVTKDTMVIKVFHDMAVDDVLENFASNAGERDWAIVTSFGSVSFFENRCDIGFEPVCR